MTTSKIGLLLEIEWVTYIRCPVPVTLVLKLAKNTSLSNSHINNTKNPGYRSCPKTFLQVDPIQPMQGTLRRIIDVRGNDDTLPESATCLNINIGYIK